MTIERANHHLARSQPRLPLDFENKKRMREGSSKHSLSYSYLQVSEPSQRLPHFLFMVHLDDQPIARYDNQTRKLAVLGCELREDGSQEGYFHYGYDGMDFISFDKETFRWVTAQPQAQRVEEKWEDDPGWFQENKHFLEDNCIVLMKKYLSDGKEALQRTEPLVGKVTRKVVNERLEVLICQAFGFYPKEIQATWTRDGEVCQYETLHRNVAPNSDGTYYVLLSIEIDPKERDHFLCHLDHEGLQEPLVLALKEEPDDKLQHPARERFALLGIIPVVLLLPLMLFLLRRNLPPSVTSRGVDETDME
ncbi:major histocompatibility complex class I-related gene protein-like [Thamnophis elegans]|uniref:major histocompatibility complex class I-related gene protein-like n=1 Tax=Thamnophis elegans TaxID=35005 RepID=UPI00137766F4|nr:major histocompatibility complex class I-related gene protein-like [Thamnophis elegans]